jgi:hypothetical protein
MKRLCLLGLVCVAALASARQLFTYRDRSGAFRVSATSGLVEQTSADKLHLVLRGKPVIVNSANDGLQIEAPSVVCDTTTNSSKISKVVGTNGVRATKRRSDGSTVITASSGAYSSGTQAARLELKGSVKIVSRTARGTTTITGHDGYAMLDNGGRGSGTGLRTASLTGPVRVESVQQNTNGGTIVATGSKLDLDNAARTVTLSGNVNVKGNQKSTLGELRGADRAVLVLNDRGQIASVRVTQG